MRDAPAARSASTVTPVEYDETKCRGSGGEEIHADGKTYMLYLIICDAGDRRLAELILEVDKRPVRYEVLETWVPDADDRQTYQLSATIEGQTGTDVAIVVREDAGGGMRATAWWLSGGGWQNTLIADAPHIWVSERGNYARVTLCFERDPHRCDESLHNERREDWGWDGAVVQRKPASN